MLGIIIRGSLAVRMLRVPNESSSSSSSVGSGSDARSEENCLCTLVHRLQQTWDLGAL